MAQDKPPLRIRLARVYREKGLRGIWFGALAGMGYRRLELLERRFDVPVPEILPRVEAEIRRLQREDERAFEALGQGDASVFRARLEHGDQCWGAWCSGSLRHVSWIAFRDVWVEYLRCRLLLDDGVAYIYRLFTEPEYRRLDVARATLAACLKALHDQGCTVALAVVLPDNPWALYRWSKVRFRRIGVVRALGTGQRPRIFVRLDRGAGAEVHWKFKRSPSPLRP
jgi:GNAT superfamily N-acetyltransferase